MNLTWQEFSAALSEVLQNQLVQILVLVVIALLLQIVAHTIIGYIVRRVVKRHRYATKADEEKREHTLIGIFRTAFAVLVWAVVIILALQKFNINIAALMTGAGLVGVVIGFGAQNTIKDFLAGMFVILENQYRIGDIITLDVGGSPVSGAVEDITVRITKLRDLDGNLHIIPNGTATMVTNRSFDYANVNIDIGVGYDADIEKIKIIINEVGQSIAHDDVWARHTIEPIKFLRVDRFGEYTVTLKALGKVLPAMQWDVAGEFRRRLLIAFSKQKIVIPVAPVVVRQKS